MNRQGRTLSAKREEPSASPQSSEPLLGKTRSSPVTLDERLVEDFFFPSKRSHSLGRKSSNVSSKSTRTVSSLRHAPVLDPSLLPEEKFMKWSLAQEESREHTGSPRGILDMEEQSNQYPIDEVTPSLTRPQDMSSISNDISMIELASSSDVSLTATDVQYLVSTLRRVTGSEFRDFIASVKKKEEPKIGLFAKQSTEIPLVFEGAFDTDYTRMEEPSRPEAIEMNLHSDRSTEKITVLDVSQEYCTDEESSTSTDFTTEFSEVGDLDTEKNDCVQSLAEPHTLRKTNYLISERVNSLLESDDSASREDDKRIHMHRRVISFSKEDRVRLYDLTEEEVLSKMSFDEDDEILTKARQRKKVKKFPGIFCIPGAKVNHAASVLTEFCSNSMESAKVSAQPSYLEILSEQNAHQQSLRFQRTYKNNEWLKDVDRTISRCPCGGISAVDTTDETIEIMPDSVPIIRTTESTEGMLLSPNQIRKNTKPMPNRSRTLERYGRSKRWSTEKSWSTIKANPFSGKPSPDESLMSTDENSSNFIKDENLNGGSTSWKGVSKVGLACDAQSSHQLRSRSKIHLLETQGGNDDDIGDADNVTRFSC